MECCNTAFDFAIKREENEWNTIEETKHITLHEKKNKEIKLHLFCHITF